LHRYRDGEAKFDGNLEDYAFFSHALIDLYEASFDEKYLKYSIKLAETMLKEFWDNENDGFFDTSGKDSSILVRTKEDYDSAEPTGNSIAILNLLRLSYITGISDLYDKAYASLMSFNDKMKKMPYAMPQMLAALDYFLHKPKQIVITGKKDDETAQEMIKEVQKRIMSDKIIIFVDENNIDSTRTFAGKVMTKTGKTTAYVCENFACKLPVSKIDELIRILKE
jgi:hypothetical protein